MDRTQTFTRDEGHQEQEVAIKYRVHPGLAAVTTGPAENWHPEEPAEVEVLSLTSLEDGSDLGELTDAEAERFRIEVLEGQEDGPDPDDLRDRRVDNEMMGMLDG